MIDRIFPKTPQQKRDERLERLESINTELHEKWTIFSHDNSKLSLMDDWIGGDQTSPDDRIHAIFGLFARAIKDGGGYDLVDITTSELVNIKGIPHIRTSIFRLGWLTPFPVPNSMYSYIDPASSSL